MAQTTLVVRIAAKKDSVEKLKCELLRMIEPTRREDGCIDYNLHQDNDNPALSFFYENWQSAEALERHTATPHFKALVAATRDIAEEMVVNKVTLLNV